MTGLIRKILITNDDGIEAGGLVRLAKAATGFGEVWVVAPLHQRSAASHSITLREPVTVTPYLTFPVEGVSAYSCSGMPADCVRVGCLGVMPCKPDVVLSGINYGYNVATDVQYSATVGAAFEAAFQGCGAIAVSEYAGEEHEITDTYLPELLAEYIDHKNDRFHIVNINFPGGKAKDCKGIKRDLFTSSGSFYRDRYKIIGEKDDGTREYIVDGIYNEDAEDGSDFRAITDGYISVGIVGNVR